MRNLFAIWRRELASCFLSPVAYVTMIVFLVASGGTFCIFVVGNEGAGQLSVLLFEAIILWLPVLIMVISIMMMTMKKGKN